MLNYACEAGEVGEAGDDYTASVRRRHREGE